MYSSQPVSTDEACRLFLFFLIHPVKVSAPASVLAWLSLHCRPYCAMLCYAVLFSQVHKAQEVANKRGRFTTEDVLFLIRKVGTKASTIHEAQEYQLSYEWNLKQVDDCVG